MLGGRRCIIPKICLDIPSLYTQIIPYINNILTYEESNLCPFMFTARSISEEFGSDAKYRDNGESTQAATHSRDPRSPKEKEDKERGDEGISIQLPISSFGAFFSSNLKIRCFRTEMIKVYDGNNSLRRRIFRVISVPRQATTEQVLTSALRAFHILKDPSTHLSSTILI